ncbi:MAG: Trk system potassium transporter TrkA [Lachnospiraceae bacterium]|nr:Trk system potassium transporter TrkA [Lachnospiraceae bacterium]
MKIIIVGCGKVGFTIASQLSSEDHDIVIIDPNAAVISSVTDELDIMGIVGNGVSHETLMEAGVKDADLVIAVTNSDEQNLICCLIARKAGHCRTIARVRNPLYHKEVNTFMQEFGISSIINPEYLAADEISRIMQFPSAIKIDRFANGRVEMLHFKVGEDSELIDKPITYVRSNINPNILVASVSRNDQVIIPKGDFVFEENDKVTIVGKRNDAISFFRKLGLLKNRVGSALIAGGGKISYYLAKYLLASGVRVTIIEQKKERCEELSDMLPDAMVICGDATDQKILDEEGIKSAQGFVALTGLDEENIFMSIYAKEVNADIKTVTKINRITFKSVIDNLDLDTVINPGVIMAENIVRYARSMSRSLSSNVEKLYKLEDGRAEAVEFAIKDDASYTGVALSKLKFKKDTILACIYRNGAIIIPTGSDEIRKNDLVVFVFADKSVSDIKEVLES